MRSGELVTNFYQMIMNSPDKSNESVDKAIPESASSSANAESTTHFGYQTVAEGEKESKVAEVFHSVASK